MALAGLPLRTEGFVTRAVSKAQVSRGTSWMTRGPTRKSGSGGLPSLVLLFLEAKPTPRSGSDASFQCGHPGGYW